MTQTTCPQPQPCGCHEQTVSGYLRALAHAIDSDEIDGISILHVLFRRDTLTADQVVSTSILEARAVGGVRPWAERLDTVAVAVYGDRATHRTERGKR